MKTSQKDALNGVLPFFLLSISKDLFLVTFQILDLLKQKMCVDAELWANSSSGFRSFVAALVCWQIDFFIISSQNFSTKPANFKCFECVCYHNEPSYWWLGISQN